MCFCVQSKHGITDVLHALGALPAGFRDSTLAKYRQSGQFQFSDYNYLLIKQLSILFTIFDIL